MGRTNDAGWMARFRPTVRSNSIKPRRAVGTQTSPAQTVTVTRWHKERDLQVSDAGMTIQTTASRATHIESGDANDFMSSFLSQRLAQNWGCKDELKRETFHAKLNYRFKKSCQIFAGFTELKLRIAAFCRYNSHEKFFWGKKKNNVKDVALGSGTFYYDISFDFY